MDTKRPNFRAHMLRRVIIDMLPYSATDQVILKMQDRLGLVPSSLDTLAMERKESNERIGTLKPISDAILEMSGLSAEAIAEYLLLTIDIGPDDDDEEDGITVDHIREVLVSQNQQVIATAVHGIVSHLVSAGVLEFSKDLTE